MELPIGLHRMFTDNQLAILREWHTKQNSNGFFTYAFTPRGDQMLIRVFHSGTKEVLELIDV